MRFRVVTVAGDVDAETEISRGLSLARHVELVLRCVDRVEFLAAVQGGALDAVIVVGAPRWLDEGDVAEASAARVRALGLPTSPEEIEFLRGIGCELLALGTTPGAVIEHMEKPAREEATTSATDPLPTGKLVAVWGPKGAPGRTRLSIELAYLAGTNGLPTALIDSDTHGGDVAQLLDLPSDVPGLPYLSRHTDELLALTGNVRWATVIPGVVDPSHGRDVTTEGWRCLTSALRSSHRLTICDLGLGVGMSNPASNGVHVDRRDIAETTVRDADLVVAVFKGDPVGVKHLLWGLAGLREICDLDEMILIANQVAAGDERSVRDAVRRHLGRLPEAFVPFRHERVVEAIRRGRPVGQGGPSEMTRALEPVVEKLGARVPPRGLLARLGGRT